MNAGVAQIERRLRHEARRGFVARHRELELALARLVLRQELEQQRGRFRRVLVGDLALRMLRSGREERAIRAIPLRDRDVEAEVRAHDVERRTRDPAPQLRIGEEALDRVDPRRGRVLR